MNLVLTALLKQQTRIYSDTNLLLMALLNNTHEFTAGGATQQQP
jgi:hypothetical protein